MKGIVLKDLLSLKGFGKTTIIVIAAFAVFSITTGNSSLISSMLLVFCGMLPMTATALDEQSRWNVYAQCMPISRKQIVSAKYLMVLIISLAAFLIAMLIAALSMIRGPVNWTEVLLVNGGVICVLLLMCAFTLPMMYKLGVEKARLAIMLVYILCLIPLFIILGNEDMVQALNTWWVPALIPLVVAAVFVASYFISVKIYRAKEF